MRSITQKLALTCALLCGLPLLHAALTAPRPWQPQQTPIAFWAWRTQAPTTAELAAIQQATNSQIVFLRAGQFDYDHGQAHRIRTVEGALPGGVALHLVYHATRDLLSAWERIEPSQLAQVIAATYQRDLLRAERDGACVVGVQLDFDVATRLLPRYAQVLGALRAQLPAGTSLSVTGLPTWMNAPQLRDVLAQTDFWTPQCYGAVIPRRIEQTIPIAAPQTVAQAVAAARQLDHPFYAGLAAYGYAILYSAQGELWEVRGDLDPALFANQPQMELIEGRPYGEANGAWRYVYQARSDVTVAGWLIKRDERVLVEVPSAEALRALARAARTEGGDKLLGLCLFRLPANDDPTTLTLPEVAAAIADRASVCDLSLSATFATPAPRAINAAAETNVQTNEATDHNTTDAVARGARDEVVLRIINAGTAGARLGPGALQIELRVPPASLLGIDASNELIGEAACSAAPALVATVAAPRRCSLRRADTVRLTARAWNPGAAANVRLRFATPPRQLFADVSMQMPDGSVWRKPVPIALTTPTDLLAAAQAGATQ